MLYITLVVAIIRQCYIFVSSSYVVNAVVLDLVYDQHLNRASIPEVHVPILNIRCG